MEYHHVPGLQEKVLIPGMKIRLIGAVVRYGIILLRPNSVQLLGGYVRELAEAFEAQALYGHLGKERKGKLQEESEAPPRFRHFDPSRRRRPQPGISKDSRDNVKASADIHGGNSNRSKNIAPFGSEKKETTKLQEENDDNGAIPVASSKMNAVAAESLLKKMERKSGESRTARQGRRRGRNMAKLSPTITLDEWEARKGAEQAPGSATFSDHELAVAMQNQFDLEDCKGVSSAGLQTELLGMFYSENPSGRSSTSRGKGRRRPWRGARGVSR